MDSPVCFQCRCEITPEDDGICINQGTCNETFQCDDCHLGEFGVRIWGDLLYYSGKHYLKNMASRNSELYKNILSEIHDTPGEDWEELAERIENLVTFQSHTKERTFTESEISQLQTDVYKITGKGEVMQCFNKLLGVSAG